MTRATPTLLIIHALGRSTQGVTTCPLLRLLSLPLCVCATHLAIWPQLQLEIYVFLARHKLRRKRDSCVERTPTARLGQRHLPALLLLLAAAACHTKIAQSSASINNNNAADGAGETGKETDPRRETGDSRKQIQIPLARSAARAEQSSPAHCNPFRVAQATCAADVATGNQLRRRRRLQELLLPFLPCLLPLPVNKKQSKVRRNICKLQVASCSGPRQSERNRRQ